MSTASTERPGLRQNPWLRRVAGLIFFGGMALLVVRHLRATPSTVSLTIRLGAAQVGLKRVSLRYVALSNGSVVRRLDRRFGGGRHAPGKLHEKLSLPDGDYRVEVDLYYGQSLPKSTRTLSGSPIGANVMRVTRRLPVRGSGAATVVIAED